MKLFCETRPIQVMGLGEIGHVIAWAAYDRRTHCRIFQFPDSLAALSNPRISWNIQQHFKTRKKTAVPVILHKRRRRQDQE